MQNKTTVKVAGFSTEVRGKLDAKLRCLSTTDSEPQRQDENFSISGGTATTHYWLLLI